MNKRIVGGVFLAVLASAVTASIVVVVAQQGDDRPPGAPSEALHPGDIADLPPPPGTPVVGLTESLDYGNFRILPAGSAPLEKCGVPVPPGLTQDTVDIRNSATLDDFRDHDLFFEPPYVPEGFELANAHAETVIWDDGSETGSLFVLRYEREGYFPIFYRRGLRAPDCTIGFVEPLPEGQHRYTLGEIRGVPVIYGHQTPGESIQADLEIHFFIDGILTSVDSVAIDFNELIEAADALIAETQQASQ